MNFGLSDITYNKIKKVINKFPKYEFKVFGSRARGDYKYNSDIDIAVFGDITTQDEFLIKNEFDLIDIIYTIDLVFMKKLTKQEFITSILEEGVKF